MYEDKIIVCKDCGQEFTFTAQEQEFYAEKGFANEPKRCRACRNAKKNGSNDNANRRPMRQLYDAVCSSCGKACKVPFQPHDDRPVLCRDCFQAQR